MNDNASPVTQAASLARRAKELTQQAMGDVDPSSPTWTFLRRAHDNLLRAGLDLEVAIESISKESQ